MATAFAAPDHSPFSSRAAKLVYAMLESGIYVHVREVASGLLAGGMCPVCQTPVIARKGDQLAAHFAHHNDDKACRLNPETRAHIWAKEVAEREKRIWLPPVRATVGGQQLTTYEGGEFTFDSVRLEQRMGDVVPDVVFTKAGREVFLEVRVTHRVDKAKKIKLVRMDHTTFEVDLSAFRRSKDEGAIAEALIRTAPRHWVHNAKIAKAEERLAAQIAEEKARMTEAIARKARRFAEARRPVGNFLSESLRKARREVAAYQLEDLLIPQVRSGNAFKTDAATWQSAVIARALIPRANGTYAPVKLIPLLDCIRDCITDAFDAHASKAVIEAAKQLAPECLFPYEVLRAYLNELVERGLLTSYGAAGYDLATSSYRRIRERRDHFDAQTRRRFDGRNRVQAVIDKLPPDECARFRIDDWLARPIDGIGRPFLAIASEGGAAWTEFERQLQAVEAMSAGRSVASSFLSLPLDGLARRVQDQLDERRRAEERRKREAVETARMQRIADIEGEAAHALGHGGAAEWLASLVGEPPTSIRDYASQSDASLQKAKSNLWKLVSRRRAEAERQAEIASLRNKLKHEYTRVLDADRAELLLHGYHPGLGNRPWDHCTSQRSFDECMALLGSGKRRR